jgi:hypothetical protein
MQAGGGSPHTGASDEQRGSLRGRSYVETAEEVPYFLHHCPDHSSPLSR